MIDSFSIEVHENGIVIGSSSLHVGAISKVYEKQSFEKALTEVYHRISTDWKVGDRVIIER